MEPHHHHRYRWVRVPAVLTDAADGSLRGSLGGLPPCRTDPGFRDSEGVAGGAAAAAQEEELQECRIGSTGYSHATARWLKRIDSSSWDDDNLHSVAFVRNPFARALAAYRYARSRPEYSEHDDAQRMTFAEWIRESPSPEAFWGRQVDFIGDVDGVQRPPGRLLVRHLVHWEPGSGMAARGLSEEERLPDQLTEIVSRATMASFVQPNGSSDDAIFVDDAAMEAAYGGANADDVQRDVLTRFGSDFDVLGYSKDWRRWKECRKAVEEEKKDGGGAQEEANGRVDAETAAVETAERAIRALGLLPDARDWADRPGLSRPSFVSVAIGGPVSERFDRFLKGSDGKVCGGQGGGTISTSFQLNSAPVATRPVSGAVFGADGREEVLRLELGFRRDRLLRYSGDAVRESKSFEVLLCTAGTDAGVVGAIHQNVWDIDWSKALGGEAAAVAPGFRGADVHLVENQFCVAVLRFGPPPAPSSSPLVPVCRRFRHPCRTKADWLRTPYSELQRLYLFGPEAGLRPNVRLFLCDDDGTGSGTRGSCRPWLRTDDSCFRVSPHHLPLHPNAGGGGGGGGRLIFWGDSVCFCVSMFQTADRGDIHLSWAELLDAALRSTPNVGSVSRVTNGGVEGSNVETTLRRALAHKDDAARHALMVGWNSMYVRGGLAEIERHVREFVAGFPGAILMTTPALVTRQALDELGFELVASHFRSRGGPIEFLWDKAVSEGVLREMVDYHEGIEELVLRVGAETGTPVIDFGAMVRPSVPGDWLSPPPSPGVRELFFDPIHPHPATYRKVAGGFFRALRRQDLETGHVLAVCCEYHDFNMTFYNARTEEMHVIELERYYQKRYFTAADCLGGKGALGQVIREQLEVARRVWGTPLHFDVCAVGHLPAKTMREVCAAVSANRFVRIDHQLAHAATAAFQSPFVERPFAVVSFHGEGNDGVFDVFRADRVTGEVSRLRAAPLSNLGLPFQYVCGLVGTAKGTVLSLPGKVMGLGAYGRVREAWIEPLRQFYADFPRVPDSRTHPKQFGEDARFDERGVPETSGEEEERGEEEEEDFEPYMALFSERGKPTAMLRGVVGMAMRGLAKQLALPVVEAHPGEWPIVARCDDKELCADLAATNQRVFEDLFLEKLCELDVLTETKGGGEGDGDARFALADGVHALALTGGCALNVCLNERLRQLLGSRLYVPPNPSDCGISVGLACLVCPPERRVDVRYNGLPLLDADRLEELANQHGGVRCSWEELADLLAEGKVVGVACGGSECGPRALGNRSILCDPTIPGLKDRLNNQIKFREPFRPFAPVVREEEAAEYFELPSTPASFPDMGHMSFNPLVRPPHLADVGAAAHVDKSARVQTVSADVHPELHRLLGLFRERTGRGVLLNTSFNIKGKPILTRVSEAIHIVRETPIDAAFVEGFLFRREAVLRADAKRETVDREGGGWSD